MDRHAPLTEADVAQALHDVAASLGVGMDDLTRDAYDRCPDKPHSMNFMRRRGWTWGRAHRVARGLAANAAGPVADAIPHGHSLRGVSTLVDAEGRVTAQWIKTRAGQEDREAALMRLLEELPAEVQPRLTCVQAPDVTDADLLAVYPMGDPHIGMLSWAPETGESFDLVKAEALICDAMGELVERGPAAQQALVVNLGDFFHSDSQHNTTARSGHHLDVDGRWPKVLSVGLRIMIRLVDLALAHHDRVRVINEIGNHDDHSAIFLSVALDAYYRHEPRVEIDMSPAVCHWYRWGRCLIGVTHGHGAKARDLAEVMAAERPEDWGATAHRYWLTGHIHHSTRQELRGCVVESFRTLAPRDAWAASQGYRSGRDMHRITLHREHGELGREVVSAAYLAARFAA